MRFTKPASALFTALVVVGLSVTAGAQGVDPVGPPGGTIYAHDETYRTVGTPALLPDHGRFDTIYVLGDMLAAVADAAPGDMEFNGGRWEVRPITWVNISPMQFTNAEDIHTAAMNGDITIGDVVTRFECPLIPNRR